MTDQDTGFTTIAVEEDADRCAVRLNRPAARNAIDQTMIDELHRVCARLESDPKILIITGTGGASTPTEKPVFASGADIGTLLRRRQADALAGITSAAFDRIAQLPMPVIAAIDGYALGGGLELALAADIRIGTPRARFGAPETGLGILAAAGASWRLRRVIGDPLAKELLLTGRLLSADEGLRLGLITHMVEPDDLMTETHRLADGISERDPLAVRLTKAVFDAPGDAHPLVDRLAQAILFESPQKEKRMRDFLERPRSALREANR